MSATVVHSATQRLQLTTMAWLLLGLLTLAAVTELRIERQDRDVYLTDDVRNVLTDEYGYGFAIAQERQWRITAPTLGIDAPLWVERRSI